MVQNEAKIESFGFSEWLILTLICCLTSAFAFTPPTFLALVFGYFLGLKSLFPLFLLNFGAILLLNLLVRFFDKKQMIQYFSENQQVKNILESLKKDELKLIFFTKLSPVLPFALMNLVFSLSGAKLKNILLGGFLGMIPRTILAVWTGLQAKEIRHLLEHPNEGNFSKIILILLIISSLGGVFYFLNRALKK